MGAAVRYILLGFAGAFLAMFSEPFFSEVLRLAGVDTSQLAGPVVTFLSGLMAEEWFRLLAAGVIGAAIGAWLHWVGSRFDRRRYDGGPMTRSPGPAARLRTQEDFPLWEAGCLFAGHPVSQDISGEALAWMQRLKAYLVDNPDEDTIEDNGPFGPIAREFRRFATRERLIGDMGDNHRIRRDTLKRAASEFGISIAGITEEEDGKGGNAPVSRNPEGDPTISMDEVVNILMDRVGYEALEGPAFRSFLQEGRITAFGKPIVGAWDPSSGHSLGAEIKIPAAYWDNAEPKWTSSRVSAKTRHFGGGLEYGLLRFVHDDVMRCYFSGNNTA
jgi:hypothetical protein